MAKRRIGTFVAAVMSTSLVVALPAHADDSSDFLNVMFKHGINAGDTATDVTLTLATAEEVCNAMYYGYSKEEAGELVPYRFPKATPEQVAVFVDAAQATMCLNEFNIQLEPGGQY